MFSPNNNRGMTYQSNPKHLSNFREYFIGVVKLTICCYNNHFLWCVFTNNPEIFIKPDIEKTCKILRLRFFWPPRLAPYQEDGGQDPILCLTDHLIQRNAPLLWAGRRQPRSSRMVKFRFVGGGVGLLERWLWVVGCILGFGMNPCVGIYSDICGCQHPWMCVI